MSPRKRAQGFEASEPARKAAAAVLQVMAGLKTAAEASGALGVTVNRYYQLEHRALCSMLKGLEPLPRGRRRNAEAEKERLERERARWEREASRYRSLFRASQKALGLAPPSAKAADSKAGGATGRKARKARVRAKILIGALSETAPAAAVPSEGSP